MIEDNPRIRIAALGILRRIQVLAVAGKEAQVSLSPQGNGHVRDFRPEAFMGAGLDAVFSPAAPAGPGIDVNSRRPQIETRRKILEFRPLRSPDIIIIIGTFFLAVAKAEGTKSRVLLDSGGRFEAILAV